MEYKIFQTIARIKAGKYMYISTRYNFRSNSDLGVDKTAVRRIL